VLDEREFYTFHQTQSWIGTVRWRVRATRWDSVKQRLNGIPVSQTGAWSPIYSSTNPPVTSGPIKLVGTVSDVFSNGSASSPAHELMPAFMWSGNQSLAGTPEELFRVEVFTDSQCLNRVYTGSVVGSPAWAPRLTGTLALPASAADVATARSSYLGDGTETNDYSFDGDKMDPAPAETLPQAQPTTSLPGDVPAFPGTAPNGTPDPLASGGSQSIQVGDTITYGSGATADSGTISAIGAGSITISSPTVNVHPINDPVQRAGGSIDYVDAELPQDACAAGRVQRLGIDSEPSLTSAQTP